MNTIFVTLKHVLELAVVIAAAILIVRFFNVGTEQNAFIVSLVLGFLAKFVRESSSIPVPDYVNTTKDNQ